MLIAFVCIVGSMSLKTSRSQSTWPKDRLLASLVRGLHEQVWTFGSALLIYLCATERGGPINDFLSMPVWQPLAKLSFSMYLIHFPLQKIYMYLLRSPVYFSFFTALVFAWGTAALTFLISIPVALFIEIPAQKLERALSRDNCASFKLLSNQPERL